MREPRPPIEIIALLPRDKGEADGDDLLPGHPLEPEGGLPREALPPTIISYLPPIQ